MLSPSPAVRIFLGLEPVDMRGGHNSLSGVVRRLGLDPLDGHLYVFLNRRRFMAALLWYDGSGWCVLKKRLSKGTFQVLQARPGARQRHGDQGKGRDDDDRTGKLWGNPVGAVH